MNPLTHRLNTLCSFLIHHYHLVPKGVLTHRKVYLQRKHSKREERALVVTEPSSPGSHWPPFPGRGRLGSADTKQVNQGGHDDWSLWQTQEGEGAQRILASVLQIPWTPKTLKASLKGRSQSCKGKAEVREQAFWLWEGNCRCKHWQARCACSPGRGGGTGHVMAMLRYLGLMPRATRRIKRF